MSDSNLSRKAVSRLLQVTRQSWMQTPSLPQAVLEPYPRPISSHRMAQQRKALQRHPVWGLPTQSSAACPMEA
jgi:hypothetical protein